VTPANHCPNFISVCFLFSDLLKGTSCIISDELVNVLTQADCPRVIDFITVVLLQLTSIQFRVKEFPASNEVFFPIMNTDIIIGSNNIPEDIISSFIVQPVPTPFSTKALNTNKISEGGSNQNEILFSLGNQ
jgi:hypothetical protein